MGFFDTFINLFRLSSPNARIYTFWGLTTVLLGSIIANYWWPGYSISAEGKKKLNFLRKKQIKGETEKTTVKIIPSPSVTAPPTTSVSTAQTTSTSTSTSTSTASNTLPGAPAHAAATPSTSEVLKEQLPKKETPAAGGKLKTVVPPTPPSTPVDSPFVAPKVSVATSSTTVSLPTATVVKDTPKVHTETKATSTLKQTITEIEVKEVPEVKPALNNNKHFVLETEPEEKTKERDAVIQEVHHPIQVEEIQPVVHRERVIKEVHQVIQPFHEEIIKAPKVIEREALPEHRAAEWEDTEEYKMKFEEGFKGIASEQSFESTQNVTIYNEPIVEEVIKKEIINVIQPVIRREIVEPTIVKITKPIYEEVHEEPVLFHKELEVKELGRTVEGLEHEKAQYFEVKKRVHTELDTEIKTTVEKKGLETKIVSNTIQTK